MVRFSELKVADLRRELDERGAAADSSGLKAVLQDRLRQIMIEEGEDPDTFEFESPEFEWAKKLEAKIEASSKQIEASTKQSESARLSLEICPQDGDYCFKKRHRRKNRNQNRHPRIEDGRAKRRSQEKIGKTERSARQHPT
ncbi:unnamed protein product, partial [Callosobruchus maculatus]